MTNASLRQQLHHFIDVADDKKIEALYHFFEKEIAPGKYSAEEVTEFYKRLEKYNTGEMPAYTITEAHSFVRQQYKKGK